MTISLSLDTSTTRTSVCVDNDGVVLSVLTHDDALAHGEILPRLVKEAISDLQIDQVVIGMGPGPFTGLRVAISFGQAFALARNIPWHGVCSLDALAYAIGETDFIVATDARRKEIFWARYVNGHRVTGPLVGSPLTINNLKVSKYGEGALKYSLTSERKHCYPDVTVLSRLVAGGRTVAEPMYIRRPDAFVAPANVKFRPMNPMDLISVYDIEKRTYKIDPWSLGQLKEELAAAHRWYFVAEIEGKVVGYVGGLYVDGITDVLTLTVDPEHRRNGIARELLRRLIDWARTQKSVAMMLDMRVGNIEALPLYESFGFVAISQRANYYGPGIDAVVMRKELQ